MTAFRLAPMSPLVRGLTVGLALLPAGLLAPALVGARPLVEPALVVLAVYAWVWLRFRPTRFVVRPAELEIRWPLKRRTLPRASITDVRRIGRAELRALVGVGLRVGAGGFGGAFGWLWTTRRGIVRMYVSRTDGFVWIECAGGRPWLLTPERPDAFVAALAPR